MRGFCLRNELSAGAKCRMPKLTGAEILSGPDQFPAPLRDLRGRLGYFAQDPFCAFKEGDSVFGQRQLTRGAMY